RIRPDDMVSDLYAGRLRMKLLIRQLVAFGDGNQSVHIGQQDQVVACKLRFVTNHTDDCDFTSLGEMSGQAAALDQACDSLYRLLGRVWLHYNNHLNISFRGILPPDNSSHSISPSV